MGNKWFASDQHHTKEQSIGKGIIELSLFREYKAHSNYDIKNQVRIKKKNKLMPIGWRENFD